MLSRRQALFTVMRRSRCRGCFQSGIRVDSSRPRKASDTASRLQSSCACADLPVTLGFSSAGCLVKMYFTMNGQRILVTASTNASTATEDVTYGSNAVLEAAAIDGITSATPASEPLAAEAYSAYR